MLNAIRLLSVASAGFKTSSHNQSKGKKTTKTVLTILRGKNWSKPLKERFIKKHTNIRDNFSQVHKNMTMKS